MNGKWMVNIIDKIGFSCYDVTNVLEIVDLGNTYNIITDEGDMFLQKDYCTIEENIIEYNTEHINVYLARITDPSGVVCAA